MIRPSGCSHRERMAMSSTTKRSEGPGESNFYLPVCLLLGDSGRHPLCARCCGPQINEGTSAHRKLRVPWPLMASLSLILTAKNKESQRPEGNYTDECDGIRGRLVFCPWITKDDGTIILKCLINRRPLSVIWISYQWTLMSSMYSKYHRVKLIHIFPHHLCPPIWCKVLLNQGKEMRRDTITGFEGIMRPR